MIVNESKIIEGLKKESFQRLYDIAYECIDNIGAERYGYVVKEVFNRYMDKKISAEQFKDFNSKVAKRQPDPKRFKL